MIAFIKGKVAGYGIDWLDIDHDGMGWEVKYAHTDRLHLGDDVLIYTYLHYTDQDLSLYGFVSKEEKELFLRLISVKGLGPKTAMSMLQKASAQDIIKAIETGNVTFLKSMPGIGAKSASQIVLDLKGKLVQTESNNKPVQSQELSDALEALKNLGYHGSELDSTAKYLSQQEGLTTQQYLRMGLQYLGKFVKGS